MFGTLNGLQVYACSEPTDMRKGYNGLFTLARDSLGRDPLSGDLFLFVSRNRKRAKVLFYDGTGLCILMKRLEQGRFVAPWERETLEMSQSELQLFLEGSTHVRLRLSPEQFMP